MYLIVRDWEAEHSKVICILSEFSFHCRRQTFCGMEDLRAKHVLERFEVKSPERGIYPFLSILSTLSYKQPSPTLFPSKSRPFLFEL